MMSKVQEVKISRLIQPFSKRAGEVMTDYNKRIDDLVRYAIELECGKDYFVHHTKTEIQAEMKKGEKTS